MIRLTPRFLHSQSGPATWTNSKSSNWARASTTSSSLIHPLQTISVYATSVSSWAGYSPSPTRGSSAMSKRAETQTKTNAKRKPICNNRASRLTMHKWSTPPRKRVLTRSSLWTPPSQFCMRNQETCTNTRGSSFNVADLSYSMGGILVGVLPVPRARRVRRHRQQLNSRHLNQRTGRRSCWRWSSQNLSCSSRWPRPACNLIRQMIRWGCPRFCDRPLARIQKKIPSTTPWWTSKNKTRWTWRASSTE